MKYPKIKPKLDRRRKLMPRDYIIIRKKFNRGISIVCLAREYRVCEMTIMRVLDDNFRRRCNEEKNQWNKEQRIIHKDDIVWREKIRREHQEHKRYRASVQRDIYKYNYFLLKNNPKVQKYRKIYNKRKWRELRSNPEKYKEYLLKWNPYKREWNRKRMLNPILRKRYNKLHREYMRRRMRDPTYRAEFNRKRCKYLYQKYEKNIANKR